MEQFVYIYNMPDEDKPLETLTDEDLQFFLELTNYGYKSTTEPGTLADADGFTPTHVEPRNKHRDRRIIELCGGIASKGINSDWLTELQELILEREY